jgi:hypothetical protein
MSAEPNTRWSLRHNLRLVLIEIARWPLITAIVLILHIAAAGAGYVWEYEFEPAVLVIVSIGTAAAVVGLKALLMLMIYPRRTKSRFPGSYLLATGIAMIPLFVFYACGFYVMGVELNDFPPITAILILFAFGYPLFTLFFAGFFRVQEWVELNGQKRHNKKLDST